MIKLIVNAIYLEYFNLTNLNLNLWKWLQIKITQILFGGFLSRNKIEVNHSRLDPGQREKINLNFNFQIFLWDFKKFYEGFKGLNKTFSNTTKKCENKNLS